MDAAAAPQYPRPISAGGYAFPPMVEDKLPIVSAGDRIHAGEDDTEHDSEDDYRTQVLLVRPTDMETLWEWLAYTKSRTDADPSWGRVWPTALSLSRLVLRSVCGGCPPESSADEGGVVSRSVRALRTSCHAVELGCGLGVAGLTYATSYLLGDQRQQYRGRRTVTFLDREPHALHCAMSSCAMNGVATSGIDGASGTVEEGADEGDDGRLPKIVARAAMDDWSLPVSDGQPDESQPGPRNVRYRDLQLETPRMTSSYDNADTVVIASDVLYEPDGMVALASKIRGLLHPDRGGHALLADPAKERTAGCRDAFVEAVLEAGGRVEIVSLPKAGGGRTAANGSRRARSILEFDVDIDGTLAETVLICVEFR